MGACRALLLAGTALVSAASLAAAADLPPPPMIEQPELVDASGWYLRGDVGVGIASAPDIRSTFYDSVTLAPLSGSVLESNVPSFARNSQHLGDAAFVDLGIGYQYNSWLRFDATGEYRTDQQLSTLESYDIAGSNFGYTDNGGVFHPGVGTYRGYDQYHGSVQSSVFLFNAYADIGTWYGITPFIGAGVGGSYNRVQSLYDLGVGGPTIIADNGNVITGGVGNGGYGYAKDSGKFDLAYAAMAGLAYTVTPNLKLELSYRYLNMGTATSGYINCVNSNGCVVEKHRYALESQDIRLGMRWFFADIAPQPTYYPPPPIVRKY